MAVTARWFLKGLQKFFNKEIDWDTDAIKVMLTTSAYVPDQDIHEFKSDVTDEVVGAGYAAGGVAIANRSNTTNAAANTVNLDGDDTVLANTTITARRGVIYLDTGVAATSILLGYVDFGQDETTNNTEFKITWAAVGILVITAGA